eukprot:636636-Rhodomonas_salina.1
MGRREGERGGEKERGRERGWVVGRKRKGERERGRRERGKEEERRKDWREGRAGGESTDVQVEGTVDGLLLGQCLRPAQPASGPDIAQHKFRPGVLGLEFDGRAHVPVEVIVSGHRTQRRDAELEQDFATLRQGSGGDSKGGRER